MRQHIEPRSGRAFIWSVATAKCPLLAISGHAEGAAITSASPPKAVDSDGIGSSRLLTRCGH
jgi:hypothetical protein